MDIGQERHKNTLLIVAGPTAVGKTELCLRLAKALNTEIISADSRQFYIEMNIGTAKPSLDELREVRHHLINSHHITEEYNAGNYESDVLLLLDKLFREKQVVLLTGGSGLYIRAVCEGMDHMPDVPPEYRLQLMQQLEQKGLASLVSKLKELDPDYYAVVDKCNSQRVVRALEVCLASGQPYSGFRVKEEKSRTFNIVKIGLSRDRQELYNRIDLRMDQMLAQGLLEEAKALYPYRTHNALQTVGYKEIFDFIDGQYDWEEAVRFLKRNSRRYAKRQLTWFRKDPDFAWFHPDDWGSILQYIQAQLK